SITGMWRDIMVIMGVDVGGAGIKGVPVDLETGELVGERFRLPTPEKAKPGGGAETIAQVVQNCDYTGTGGRRLPAVVRGGIVYTAANIHKSWLETDVEALLREATGCPVYVINDADAAGLAEMRYGVGRQYQQGVVIMVTIGTGLGTALFVDGKLVPNTELGHIEIRGK